MAPPKKSSRLQSFLVVILGLALLGLAVQAIFGPRGHLEMERLEEDNQSLRRQKEAVEAEIEQVMQEIESLKTDPDTIEKIAREELGLIKDGEIKIIAPPSPQDPGGGSGPSE